MSSTSVNEEPSPNQIIDDENDISATAKIKESSNFNNSTVAAAVAISGESGGEDSLSPPFIQHKQSTSSSSSSATAAAISTPKTTITATTLPPSSLEQHCRLLEEENQNLKCAQTQLQQQYSDAQRRERILMRRLANKEQEFQDYVSQIAEYKSAQAPGPAALRSALLDPAVNVIFEKLKTELKAIKAKLEETQNELSAWKFTPDSNTGKRLMAKCRQLYQENEELGKMMSNGRLAKLEGELAMQKSFSEEVKKCQSELDDYLQELDEDVEGMQSTIYFLQQELKSTRDRIQFLEKENYQLKNGLIDPDAEKQQPSQQTTLVINGKTSSLLRSTMHDEKGSSDSVELGETFENDERTKRTGSINYNVHNNNGTVIVNNNMNNSNNNNNNNSNNNLNEEINLRTNRNSDIFNGNELNGDDDSNEIVETTIATTTIKGTSIDGISNNTSTNNVQGNCIKNARQPPKKRSYDSDSSDENSSTNGGVVLSGNNNNKGGVVSKKLRRSSVLSIDLNEEDTQITGEEDEEEEEEDSDDEEEEENNQRVMTRRKSSRTIQNVDLN